MHCQEIMFHWLLIGSTFISSWVHKNYTPATYKHLVITYFHDNFLRNGKWLSAFTQDGEHKWLPFKCNDARLGEELKKRKNKNCLRKVLGHRETQEHLSFASAEILQMTELYWREVWRVFKCITGSTPTYSMSCINSCVEELSNCHTHVCNIVLP